MVFVFAGDAPRRAPGLFLDRPRDFFGHTFHSILPRGKLPTGRCGERGQTVTVVVIKTRHPSRELLSCDDGSVLAFVPAVSGRQPSCAPRLVVGAGADYFNFNNRPSSSVSVLNVIRRLRGQVDTGLAAAQLYASGSNTVGADYAVRMNGGAQYLEVPGAGVDLVDKSFTLEIWVKRARGATEEVLFSQGTGATGKGLQFGFLADDKVRFSFWSDGDCDNVYNAFDAGSGAVVEQWTHWAATCAGQGRGGPPGLVIPPSFVFYNSI